jgi:small neutral amino acid transporter SnatA (MarC family)
MPRIQLDATLFATAFVTVLVIMDPLGNVPIFLSLTRGHTLSQQRPAALLAGTVAGGVILSFALFGQQVLTQLVRPAGGGHGDGEADSTNMALVPLGTPLLAGPGAIAATMLYARQAVRSGVS